MVTTVRAVVLGAANTLLLGYFLLILLRVALSWFQVPLYGQHWAILYKATDPYLNLFRRIRFLRRGAFDFSPFAALLVLLVARHLVSDLLRYGHLWLGLVLGVILGALWEGVGFLLLFFAAFCVFRLVGIGMRSVGAPGLWQALDVIVQPVTDGMQRLLGPARRLRYPQVLALTSAILLTFWFLGGLGVRVLVRLVTSLPF